MIVSKAKDKALNGFLLYGFELESESDGQWAGWCPFCGKDKFYINCESFLWDCKAGDCGRTGNYNSFLAQVYEHYYEQTTTAQYKVLSEDRSISWKVLKDCGWAYTGEEWILPVYNVMGKHYAAKGCSDLRRYNIKSHKVYSSPNSKLGIYNAIELKDPNKIELDVFLCESGFDAAALQWVLNKTKRPGIVVSVPGAKTFKQSWVELFQNRRVYVCFDNDKAGADGMAKINDYFKAENISAFYINWNKDTEKPDGYDVRDLVKEAKDASGPKYRSGPFHRAYNRLISWCQLSPGNEGAYSGRPDYGLLYLPYIPKKHIQVVNDFRQFIEMKSSDFIVLCMGTILANRIEGDPVWLMPIGAPGVGKTVLLMALSNSPETMMLETLTPSALISGDKSGPDTSLIPLLNNKVGIFKDLTVFLTMNPLLVNESFGYLRGGFDGFITKSFGNKVTRTYHSQFGLIAGCTPAIDSHSQLLSSLGERWIKYRINNPSIKQERVIIETAMSNIGNDKEMKETLRNAVLCGLAGKSMKELPSISGEHKNQIISMSQVSSLLRGSVVRDRYKDGLILNVPTREVGTRLSKQLTKLGMGMASYLELTTFNKRIINILRKCSIDCAPGRRVALFKAFLKEAMNDWLSSAQLTELCNMPRTTVRRVADDMYLLGMINRNTSRNKVFYSFTDQFRELIRLGGY